jgi:hypothetical protein
LSAAFPGIDLNDSATILFRTDYSRLPAGERNRIAIAAARELSLRTARDDVITKETVDELAFKPASNDTPVESALRRLNSRNAELVELLCDMENQNLINDPGVIGPLIEMLDYPGTKTSVRGEAAQVLSQLTKRTWAPNHWQWDGERHGQFVAWWRTWWVQNHDKHPVFDSDIEAWAQARVATIALQLHDDFQDYYEINGFVVPDHVQRGVIDPQIAFIGVNTAGLQQAVMRSTDDGKPRIAGKNDYVSLRIAAEFATPPPNRRPDERTASGIDNAPNEEVLHEILPGTDVLITVQAASKDAAFLPRVRASVSKLPPAPESLEAAREHLPRLKRPPWPCWRNNFTWRNKFKIRRLQAMKRQEH